MFLSIYLKKKAKNKIYHTLRMVRTSNRKIVEAVKINNTNTHHGSSLSWIGTSLSIKTWLVLYAQI
jgi:hypothetical protein